MRFAISPRANDVPRVPGFAEDHLPHTILHPAQFRDIWHGEGDSPERELAAAVLEAAAVGMPNEIKGEELWAYIVLAPGREPSDALRSQLTAAVTDALGKAFTPAGIRFVASLPKTRSAKVLRRAIRATALGVDPGDLSSLEDPASIDAIRSAS